jgi:LysM repeat protein
MQKTRDLASGFLLGVVFIMIIIGGAALALAESNLVRVNIPPTQTPITTAPILPTNTFAPSQTASIITDTVAPAPTETPSLPPPPTTCPPPNGWIAITIKADDTLYTLAARYNVTPETLAQQNCLLTADLPIGAIIYVPPVPTSVPTACRPPGNWVVYRVQPGDNLYRISLKYRITVAQLQRGNCMGTSQLIYSGQRLYVPNVATSTPDATNTPAPSATLPPTATDSPVPLTPTDTPVPPSATTAPSDTPAPSATP